MTVKELIAELEKVEDKDLEVFMPDEFFGEPSRDVYQVSYDKYDTVVYVNGKPKRTKLRCVLLH